MTIKAIETRYKGYRFRSRLEARWAVFFDALGVEYQYEPEGFELPDGERYLPDFHLPKIGDGLWVEIKGISPTRDEYKKLFAVVNGTGKNATFRVGDPMMNVEIGNASRKGSNAEDDAWIFYPCEEGGACSGDGPYIFCLCPWCGKVGFQFFGRGARVCGYRAHFEIEAEALAAIEHLGHWRADDKCYTGAHWRIREAASKARAARFEHGECPA